MFVVTGNRLLDGIVVYLASGHAWVEDLKLSHCFESQEEAQAALDVQIDMVVSLEVIPVAKDDLGDVVASGLRERIRAEGPTINPFASIDLVRRFDVVAK
ncbi:DUF2849 domain-containing protein [Cohaesibacter celericrescens]|uniref:DUF2849 domain-containing protein n=1 Tax=Cohaesibacter celericrescens TaxID=2067669 RepID=A0A2N5XSQ2_9HYPH|nr:DUF2849 domain-containing protein [Cohaesibacter celericrescens]PLW77551.1 DUF2849 domain-containing protein [Cohaesibacter celericrescens]